MDFIYHLTSIYAKKRKNWTHFRICHEILEITGETHCNVDKHDVRITQEQERTRERRRAWGTVVFILACGMLWWCDILYALSIVWALFGQFSNSYRAAATAALDQPAIQILFATTLCITWYNKMAYVLYKIQYDVYSGCACVCFMYVSLCACVETSMGFSMVNLLLNNTITAIC